MSSGKHDADYWRVRREQQRKDAGRVEKHDMFWRIVTSSKYAKVGQEIAAMMRLPVNEPLK